jgi:hypothetical protein
MRECLVHGLVLPSRDRTPVAAQRGGDVAAAVGVRTPTARVAPAGHGAAAEMTSVQQPL